MIQPGLYRHYKGKDYLVIGTAVHSETREMMVLYTPRYESDEGLVVRPLELFTDHVEVDGQQRARFSFIRSV